MDPPCLVTTVQAGGGGIMVWWMFSWHTLGPLVPIGHCLNLWDVVEWELHALDVHPTNLHQLQDAILSIWANISKECFQHLVESMPHPIKAVLKHSISTVFLTFL